MLAKTATSLSRVLDWVDQSLADVEDHLKVRHSMEDSNINVTLYRHTIRLFLNNQFMFSVLLLSTTNNNNNNNLTFIMRLGNAMQTQRRR